MKNYTLDDILDFGKNKGESIRDIYQFDPSYIQYLIIYTNFFIDIKLFKNLPTPTPITPFGKINIGKFYGYTFNEEMTKKNMVRKGKDMIINGLSIPKINFVFSPIALKALEEKRAGVYVVPKNESTFSQAHRNSQDDEISVA